MGQAIAAAAAKTDVEITAGLDLGDDIAKQIDRCDVVIDFSHPNASSELARACREAKKAVVIGTTGHSKEERASIEELSRSTPVVLSPNFSVGVNALFWLTRKAAQMLGDDFDLEITEMHHRLKKDAPSGTAKKLAEIFVKCAASITGRMSGTVAKVWSANVRRMRSASIPSGAVTSSAITR